MEAPVVACFQRYIHIYFFFFAIFFSRAIGRKDGIIFAANFYYSSRYGEGRALVPKNPVDPCSCISFRPSISATRRGVSIRLQIAIFEKEQRTEIKKKKRKKENTRDTRRGETAVDHHHHHQHHHSRISYVCHEMDRNRKEKKKKKKEIRTEKRNRNRRKKKKKKERNTLSLICVTCHSGSFLCSRPTG